MAKIIVRPLGVKSAKGQLLMDSEEWPFPKESIVWVNEYTKDLSDKDYIAWLDEMLNEGFGLKENQQMEHDFAVNPLFTHVKRNDESLFRFGVMTVVNNLGIQNNIL